MLTVTLSVMAIGMIFVVLAVSELACMVLVVGV